MKTTSSKIARLSDKELVNDLSGKIFSASRRRLPIIIAFFYYILRFLFSVGAFISRAALRSKLGERTYGVITVLFVYIFFAFVQVSMEAVPIAKDKIAMVLSDFNDGEIIEEFTNSTLYDLLGIYYLSRSHPKTQGNIERVSGFLVWETFRRPVIEYKGLTGELNFFWWFIILISCRHFTELFIRRRRGDTYHSFYRGNSIFSYFIGRKILGLKIKDFHIWIFLEPLFILLIAYWFNYVLEFKALGIVLAISAGCLFLEEYSVYLENRSLVLDIIDSLIDGKKLAQVQEGYSTKINSSSENIRIEPIAIPSATID